jgi:hypothetical protein
MPHPLQRALAITALALAAQIGMPTSALAQVSFNIQVGPPAPLYEPVPAMGPGYVWAPGYWAWHGDRHIWIHGRTMVQRVGYRWQPDVWEQRSNNYYRHPGRWERDNSYRPAPALHTPLQRPQVQHNGGPGRNPDRGNNGNRRNNGRPDNGR